MTDRVDDTLREMVACARHDLVGAYESSRGTWRNYTPEHTAEMDAILIDFARAVLTAERQAREQERDRLRQELAHVKKAAGAHIEVVTGTYEVAMRALQQRAEQAEQERDELRAYIANIQDFGL